VPSDWRTFQTSDGEIGLVRPTINGSLTEAKLKHP
jgi:hypothetical protein